ncbi:MAG: FAD-dependent oxidoreductase [Chitinophagales bacterium]
MTRNEFIKMCSILGISLPFQSFLTSCEDNEVLSSNFNGKVIIIGAGAGGLSAAYLLQQRGIDYEILEASLNYGGRMKINNDFADFPIPLGAEWLETNTNIFKEIVNDSSITVDIDTIADHPDRKFVNSSWFNFFETYIVPSVANQIIYDSAVQSIDYTSDQVIVTTQNDSYTADKVIVSVPLKILQDGDINFLPNLPQTKLDAINEPIIWEGFKAFFEFSTKFYGEEYEFNISPETNGQKIFYNGAYGQNSSKNILGLFVVGIPALDYLSLSEEELKNHILNELDTIYNNQASSNYLKHISQNWQNEPFIKAGYMSDYTNWRTVKKLSESIADKIYFAGGAYTDGEDWVSVHTAAQSAANAVKEILI